MTGGFKTIITLLPHFNQTINQIVSAQKSDLRIYNGGESFDRKNKLFYKFFCLKIRMFGFKSNLNKSSYHILRPLRKTSSQVFWKWTCQKRPTWREDKTEAIVIFTVFVSLHFSLIMKSVPHFSKILGFNGIINIVLHTPMFKLSRY